MQAVSQATTPSSSLKLCDVWPELPAGSDIHEFAHLDAGVCHFQLCGPSNQDLIILLHGATVPLWEFDRLLPFLHRAGYSTLRLDLYGHGFSARPVTTYDIDLFRRQVCALLDHLWPQADQHKNLNACGRPENIYVLGHSLGAAVAASLVTGGDITPKALLLAGPLVNFTANQTGTRLLGTGFPGKLLVQHFVVPFLKRRRENNYKHLDQGQFVAMFERQISLPGFDQALHSLFAAGTLGDQLQTYASLDTSNVPTTIIRGENDFVVTAVQIEQLKSVIPAAKSLTIPDAGHPFMLTHPDTAGEAICKLLL